MQEYTVKVFDNKTRWYQNGQLHRIDGPAIEWSHGTKAWYQNDELHRLDGPAIEWADGDKSWFQNRQLHRLDGPAIELTDGYKEYWIDGIELTESEFNDRTNKKELSVAEIEQLLGYPVKIIK